MHMLGRLHDFKKIIGNVGILLGFRGNVKKSLSNQAAIPEHFGRGDGIYIGAFPVSAPGAHDSDIAKAADKSLPGQPALVFMQNFECRAAFSRQGINDFENQRFT